MESITVKRLRSLQLTIMDQVFSTVKKENETGCEVIYGALTTPAVNPFTAGHVARYTERREPKCEV